MYHLRKLTSFLLLLLVVITAKAQLSDGKVYNFANVGNNTQSMVISGIDGAAITGTNMADYNQLWYVSRNSDNSYSLRNLGNGRYLRSSNVNSGRWTMVKADEFDANCKFNCTSAGSGYTLRATNTTNGYHYMHYGANQGAVVCWSADATATQWTITSVSIDESTLNANWNALASIDPNASTVATYQACLETLFSDKACTTLNSTYASMSETNLKNQSAYKNLPVALQQMVLKVRNNSWSEANYNTSKASWGADYAKKYRVQLYEPYNEPEAAASALGLNAHTNLNNPTGIFANNHEVLYVMVEGAVKEGSSLYITSYTGNGKPGGYDNGYELKQGLNVIPSFANGNNYCINYVVHTFDTSKGKGNKAKARKLSDYSDLKIHIEGGHINGYYNKVGDALYAADKNADWEYIEARATQTTVTVLGEYITLQFPLRDEDSYDEDGKKNKGLGSFFNDLVNIEGVIDEWDNVMLWERFLLGVATKEATKSQDKNVKSPYSASNHVVEYTGNDGDDYATDYGDYYNVHGLSFGIPNSYMYGGWDHCGYNFNTMGSIIGEICTNAGSHWGPAHEIGHQHQGLLNMNGLTEVTNNLFSNVVLWYFGESTSRVNGSEGSLSNVLAAYNTEGSDFFTNNIWAQTHMYYKLFLYYHVLGHNPKFYPRLFEMLRQDPMTIEYNQDGAKSLLHFYKKCCYAAGEDLTEFFRAYGVFRVMTDRFVGDYSNAVYNMTQAQIDAAIAEVKELNYEENIAVLFINDATGETIKSHKGDNLELYGETTICAEVGGYASFNANTTPDYTYTVSGTTISMVGEGGTGIAIFNDKGELIAFSDKKTFTISKECTEALVSGKAKVKTIQADNTVVEATDVMDTDKSEAKYAALGELLAAVADLLTYSDADNSKPGFYRASVLETLRQLYAEAQSVYSNKEEVSYATAYETLFQEYTYIVTSDTDKTPFLPGSTYVLTNKKYPNVSMTLNSDKLIASVTNMSSSAQQWTFEATDEKDVYYLKNGSSYLGSLLQSTQVGVTTKETASRYKLYDLGKGLWALQCQNDALQSLHCDAGYKIVGWSHTSTDNDASWWYLTATVKDESMLPLYDLQNLITKTEALVDEMATVRYDSYVDMKSCNITSNYTASGYGTEKLVDGDPATFFHSTYSGTTSAQHNLVIDLGSQQSLSEFVINYTTLPKTFNTGTSNTTDAPTKILVEGSNNGSSYSEIATLSGNLPTGAGAKYTSEVLGNASNSYRYIRLTVQASNGAMVGLYRYYFGLAELSLTCPINISAIGDKYAEFISVDEIKAVCEQIQIAKQKCAAGAVTSADIVALQSQYDLLFDIYNRADNDSLKVKKQELFELISSTNSLINTCGRIIYTPATSDAALALQTSNVGGDFYLSTNAAEPKEGSLDNLIDESDDTYFHSAWSWDVEATHYLKVDLGEGKSLKEFTFSYKTTKGLFPKVIEVYGSNDERQGTLLRTFTMVNDGLPNAVARSWTSPAISSETSYKYLRFEVTESEGGGYGATPKGEYCFVMSYFGITAIGQPESYAVELGEEAGDVDEELLLTTYKAVQSAQAACDRASTEAQLQSAIEDLNAAKEALYQAMYTNVEYTIQVVGVNTGGVIYKGMEYSSTMIASENLTVDQLNAIAVDGYVAKSVTLNGTTITVTYNKIYSVQVVGIDAANGGVKLGGTTYKGGTTFNMLESEFNINDFTAIPVAGYAAYKTFDGTTITVTYKKVYNVVVVGVADQGGVTFDGESYANNTRIEVLGTLDENQLVSLFVNGYESVIELSHENATVTVTYTAIDKTELINLITETQALVNDASNYLGSSLNVTETVIAETNAMLATAIAVRDNSSVNRDEYEVTLAALQVAKSKLATAITYANLPVQLTFDVNSPITYKITINRNGYPVLAYDSGTDMVAVTTIDLENKAHGWYFVPTTDGKVRIMPYYNQNTTLALSTNSFSEGNSKVKGMAIGTDGYTQEWTITNANMNEANRNAGWYNIICTNGTNTCYFSNHGGVNQKMGFYNNANDGGSLFKFGRVRFGMSEKYKTLYDYYTNKVKVASGNLVGSNAVGYYPEALATAYNDAYNNATSVLADANATDVDYTNAYHALVAANEALVMNTPEAGKFYTIKNNGYCITGNTTSGGRIALSATNDVNAIYYYDGSHLLSYSTGLYMGLNATDWTFEAVGSNDISTITFVEAVNGASGAFNVKSADRWLHRTDEYVNRCSNNTCGDAHNWIIEEVTSLPVNVNEEVGFASFYAPVALTMPEGMTAYVVTDVDGDRASIVTLAEAGEVIPANTGVLLAANGGFYELAIANADDANDVDGVNLLHGSIDDQYIKYGNTTCYMLGYKDGVVGLYMVSKNLTSSGVTDEENGTHFKNEGFKSYLIVSSGSNVAVLSIYKGATTEIDNSELIIQNSEMIYDLYGRRIFNVTSSGLYIVNGEKRYIQTK